MDYKGIIITPKMYQRICKPEHFMLKYQGFGISLEILNKLMKDNVKFIMFIYQGKKGNSTYFATTIQYLESEKEHKDGEDIQKFVSIREMVRF